MAFEVEIKDLRDSAKAAREAASAVGKVTPGASLRGAKTSIPGASSVATLEQVATSWGTELADWVQAANGYAKTLEDNAAQYAADDQAAKAAFGGVR
jgi:hypothetical protein